MSAEPMQWFTTDADDRPIACVAGTPGAWAMPAADFANLLRFLPTNQSFGDKLINRVRVERRSLGKDAP